MEQSFTLMRSNLSVFHFMDRALGVKSKNSLPSYITVLQICPAMSWET